MSKEQTLDVWVCMDGDFKGEKSAAITHSNLKEEHVIVVEGSLSQIKFKQDCGNVPFLHCEDGCDCGDCGMCGR